MSYSRASQCFLLSTCLFSILSRYVPCCVFFIGLTFRQCCVFSQSNLQCIIHKPYSNFSCAKHYPSAVEYCNQLIIHMHYGDLSTSLTVHILLVFQNIFMHFICYGQEPYVRGIQCFSLALSTSHMMLSQSDKQLVIHVLRHFIPTYCTYDPLSTSHNLLILHILSIL